MDAETITIIGSAASGAVQAFISLIAGKVGAILNAKPQARKKLTQVYREINADKILLEKYGFHKTPAPTPDSIAFKTFAANLSNAEIVVLYKNMKVIRLGLVIKGNKKAEKYRRIQYALDYIVRQIDELKTISCLTSKQSKTAIRLVVRLRTLHKHLNTIEKVLRPVRQ